VLVERLLPGSPVLAMEHIFELYKAVNPGEVAFFAPLLNSGIILLTVNSMPYLPISLWMFDMTFATQIVALQLVTFG
jgi:hypothetical protein